MIKALAPRMPRGCSWVWLSIVVALSLPPSAGAQPGGKAKAAAKDEKPKAAAKDEKPKAAAKDKDEKPDADKDDKPEAPAAEAEAEGSKKGPTVEVFRDPRAETILKKTYSAVGRPNTDRGSLRQIQSMAAGESQVERVPLERFVLGEAYELTSSGNVAALREPSAAGSKPNPKALAIRNAADHLLDMIDRAKRAKNPGFLKTYTDILASKDFLSLLNNNLFARTEAMIILGQTGSPELVSKVFVPQLKDPNQTILVKLWAARGIINATEDGTRDLSTGQAVEAARAVANWLDKEKDLPWPFQLRGLEALGALRQSNDPSKPSQPEFAAAAMKFLADAEGRPEVRATAASAIGLMRINPSLAKFNFSLVAYNIAEVAVDLGEKAHDVHAENSVLSAYYTDFLLYSVLPALEGKEGVANSGLIKLKHPNIGPSQNFLKQTDELVRAVATSALNLLRTPPGKAKDAEKDLSDRVAALKLFLDKNTPTDVHLIPGGPPYPVKPPQVAAGK